MQEKNTEKIKELLKQYSFDDLARSIKEDLQPISSGIDGLRSLEIISALYNSSKKNSKEVIINYKDLG